MTPLHVLALTMAIHVQAAPLDQDRSDLRQSLSCTPHCDGMDQLETQERLDKLNDDVRAYQERMHDEVEHQRALQLLDGDD
jgi:hypothetical protein